MEHQEYQLGDAASPKKKRELTLPTAIVVAGVIIALAILAKGGMSASAAPDELDYATEIRADDVIRGDSDAPITIIEYADFSCHFCAEYHPVLRRIVEESDGRVRWIYRDLPIFNIPAAVAGRCVARTAGDRAFWQFSDALFANPEKRSDEYYQAMAVEAGAVAEAYRACADDPLVESGVVSAFQTDRLLLGFSATPHTIIIDKAGRTFSFSGALTYEMLTDALAAIIR